MQGKKDIKEISDRFGRRINYLRVSVTDRCNLRCRYCVPEGMFKFMSPNDILSYEEIFRLLGVGSKLGITKVRITGGEPLVRSKVTTLIRMIAGIQGITDISITTNGQLLEKHAPVLRQSGIKRINISLDTLEEGKFSSMTRLGSLPATLRGIEAAAKAGLNPIKLNVVALKGFNDDEFGKFVTFAEERGLILRFIEYMPFWKDPEWKASFIPREEIRKIIGDAISPEPESGFQTEKTVYYRSKRGAQVGFISPVSHGFCSNCNRLRLTADGKLRSCLPLDKAVDVKTVMRSGGSDEKIAECIVTAILNKPEKGVYEREGDARPMSSVGG
jgi:cyclic pyranopterin phosphate synthase